MGEEQPVLTGWSLLYICSGDNFKKDKAQDAHLRINLKFTLHLSFGVEKPQLKENRNRNIGFIGVGSYAYSFPFSGVWQYLHSLAFRMFKLFTCVLQINLKLAIDLHLGGIY